MVSFACLPGALSVFFGEWVRGWFAALSAFQLCFHSMVFVGNVQCREHGQLGTIGRVGFGNGTHHRINILSEFPNVVGIFAAQGVRLTENLGLHARVICFLSHVVNSKPPADSVSWWLIIFLQTPVRSKLDTSSGADGTTSKQK